MIPWLIALGILVAAPDRADPGDPGIPGEISPIVDITPEPEPSNEVEAFWPSEEDE